MTGDGKRKLARDHREIYRKMIEGRNSINGRAKGLWVMPQIFSYYSAGEGRTESMQPTFEQARWDIMNGMANGAAGMVPFMFCEYWNDIENRIGVSSVFEVLSFLEPGWIEGGEIKLSVSGNDNQQIAALAKTYRLNGKTNVHIIASNQTEGDLNASFSCEELKPFKRLYVVQENRTVELKNGSFSDQFAVNGAHVYTTCEVLPYFPSLAEIKRQIEDVKGRIVESNRLRDGKTDWAVTPSGRNARIYGDELADGCIDGGGWFPWYSNRKELVLVFPHSVKFDKFVFYSNNIGKARLEIWRYGKWEPLHTWDEIHQFVTTWQGPEQEAVKLRLLVDAVRNGQGFISESIPNISEIEIY